MSSPVSARAPIAEPRRVLTPVIPYLMSRIAKTVVLAAFALILAAVYLNGAPILALILFLLVAFGLSLIETLIRADAVELIGTDLIRVTGLLGILMLFEMMMVACFRGDAGRRLPECGAPGRCGGDARTHRHFAGASEYVAQLPAPRAVLGGWYNEAKCRRSLKRS